MRLLFISNAPAPYQVELFSRLSSEGLAEVNALFCGHGASALRRNTPELPPGFEVLPGIGLPWLSPDLRINFGLARRIDDIGPDVAIVGGYMMPGLRKAMGVLGKKSIPWLFWEEYHRFSRNPLKKALRKRLLMNSLGACSAVLAIGSRAASFFTDLIGGDKPVHNFPYASDLNRFTEAERRPVPGRIRFLFSGQLIARKGVDVLLDAFARVAEEYECAELTILGDGPERSRLQRSVPEAMRDRVRFEGTVQWEGLPARYAAADVFAFPSRHDGWGLVVPEAMAAGMPVISTLEVGSALDLVEEGRTGFLVESGDAAMIAEKMAYFCDNTDRVNAMGRLAAERAKSVDVIQAGPKLIGILEDYCG